METNKDLTKQLAEVKIDLQILEETTAVRTKYRKGSDDYLKLSEESSILRVRLGNLEQEFYGGFVASLKARVRHLEGDMQSRPQLVERGDE